MNVNGSTISAPIGDDGREDGRQELHATGIVWRAKGEGPKG
jgi:hypothetical protein